MSGELLVLVGMLGLLMVVVAALETLWRCLRPALSSASRIEPLRVSPIRLQSLSQGDER